MHVCKAAVPKHHLKVALGMLNKEEQSDACSGTVLKACLWGEEIKGSPATLFSMQIMYANISPRCQLLYNKLRLCSSFGLVWTSKKSVQNIIFVIVL